MEEKDGVYPKSAHPKIDIRLQALLEVDDQQYQFLLDNLIKEHAEPLIHKIIHAKLKLSQNKSTKKAGNDDANDLCQDSITKLIAHLKQLRTNPIRYAISAFDEFVAKVTFNVYNNYVRAKYPHRHKLKRQLEHLLKSRKEFDLWKDSSDRLAGLAHWRDGDWSKTNPGALQTQSFVLAQLDEPQINQIPLVVLLTKFFEWANQPVAFDELVSVIAEVCGIKDGPQKDWPVAHQASTEQPSGEGIRKLEYHEHLRQAWKEILALPIRQRYALLLNWKNSATDSFFNALIIDGITSTQNIAKALQMDLPNLEKIWDQLPLKDAAIGEMLGGLPAQAVANLRKSARERLARRMKKNQDQSPKS